MAQIGFMLAGLALMLGLRRAMGRFIVAGIGLMAADVLFSAAPHASAFPLSGAPAGLPLLVAALPFAVILGAIWLLQRIIRPIFGETASVYVGGTYPVRFIDLIGRLMLAVGMLPVRLLRSLFTLGP